MSAEVLRAKDEPTPLVALANPILYSVFYLESRNLHALHLGDERIFRFGNTKNRRQLTKQSRCRREVAFAFWQIIV